MTRFAAIFERHTAAPITARGGRGIDEQELSNWAEQSTIAASGRSGHTGTIAFWLVVAALLAVRFFVVDPAKLRPVETSSSSNMVVSQQAEPAR